MLWSARVISRLGSALSYVVLLWLTYSATSSALAVAYVGVVSFVPTIVFGVVSGALVDRWDRRRAVVGSTLARAASMGGLLLGLAYGGFHLWYVLAASFAFAACSTFMGPGTQALLPELVPSEQLDPANGLISSTESAAGIAGNALGGILLVLIGVLPSLALDIAGYLVGAACVALIASRVPPGRTPGRPKRLLAEIGDGFRYLRSNLGLLQLTLGATALNFLFSLVLTFLVIFAGVSLHGGATLFGALEAAIAAGDGAGAFVAGRIGLSRATGRVWALAGIGQGGAVLVAVAFPNVAVAIGAFATVGVLVGVLNLTWLTTVQATVPRELQGRYIAIDNALSFGAIPAAQLVGGVVVLVAGITTTFLLAGAGMIGVGAVLLTFRALRALGRPERSLPG